MSRVIDADGIALVKQFEGLYTQAYRCPAGVWTIGYGHTDGVTPGMSISEKQAEKYLKDDLAAAGEQVGRLVKVPLNNHQFAALASFVFNVGTGNLSGYYRYAQTHNIDAVVKFDVLGVKSKLLAGFQRVNPYQQFLGGQTATQ